MRLVFSWDPRKAKANIAKHGVTFERAATAFADPLARIFVDEWHSSSERREILVGYSNDGSLLVISFTQAGSTVRLISARVATARERRKHEKEAFSR